MKRAVRIAIFILSLIGHACVAAEGTLDYNPVIRMGNGPLKNLLFVIWDHSQQKSGWAYHTILRSMAPEIRSGHLTVLMYQATTDSAEDHNAALFSCVPKKNYAQLVSLYLDDLDRRSASQQADALLHIRLFAKDLGLPHDLARCWSGASGRLRLAKLHLNYEIFSKRFGIRATPAFILNGRVVNVTTAADLEDQLLKD